MRAKKVFGYIFFALFILLGLAVIGMIQSLAKAMFGFFKIFTGTLSANQVGIVIGDLIYWALHFGLMYVLWKYARKWVNEKKTAEDISASFLKDSDQEPQKDHIS